MSEWAGVTHEQGAVVALKTLEKTDPAQHKELERLTVVPLPPNFYTPLPNDTHEQGAVVAHVHRVQWLRVEPALRFGVQGFEFRILGLGFWAQGFGFVV